MKAISSFHFTATTTLQWAHRIKSTGSEETRVMTSSTFFSLLLGHLVDRTNPCTLRISCGLSA